MILSQFHYHNDDYPMPYHCTSSSEPSNPSLMATFPHMGSSSSSSSSSFLCAAPPHNSTLVPQNICSYCYGFDKNDKNGKEGSVSLSEEEIIHMGGGQAKVCVRGHWKPAEDAKLKKLVALYGPQNWNLIAEKLQGRSGKSCRLRWFNQLDPRINRSAFSEEEEERLMAAHRTYGNKWALIARLFPGRTDNAVKNHWHVIMARKYRQQCFADKKKKKLITQATQTRAAGGGDDDGGLNIEEATSGRSVLFVRSSNLLSLPHESCSVLQTPFDFFSGHKSCKSCEIPSLKIIIHCKMAKDGSSESMASSSQFSVSEPSSSSSLSFAENQSISDFDATISPPFIDFLGVGAT